MFDRLISFLVALGLGFLVWLYVRSRDQEMLDNVPVPVQLTLTPDQADAYELEVLGPSQVPISFTGPPSRMRQLRHVLRLGELRIALSLNAPEGPTGQGSLLDTVRIDASDVHAPPGVKALIAEGRNQIPVKFHRLVERRLPVRLDYTGERKLSHIVFEPDTVLVRAPQDILEHTRALATQPFTLSLAEESAAEGASYTAEAIPLKRQLDGRRIHITPTTVAVQLNVEPQQKGYALTDVPVHFLCPANFALEPLFSDTGAGRITVRLVGPAGEEPPAVLAFLDLTGQHWKPGIYEAPVQLHLPANFQLAQAAPQRLAFQLAPRETPTKP